MNRRSRYAVGWTSQTIRGLGAMVCLLSAAALCWLPASPLLVGDVVATSPSSWFCPYETSLGFVDNGRPRTREALDWAHAWHARAGWFAIAGCFVLLMYRLECSDAVVVLIYLIISVGLLARLVILLFWLLLGNTSSGCVSIF